MSKKRQWWLYGAIGTLFLGSGLSLAIESGYWKHDGSHWMWWVTGGTAGIAMVVSGVVVLIKAGQISTEINR